MWNKRFVLLSSLLPSLLFTTVLAQSRTAGSDAGPQHVLFGDFKVYGLEGEEALKSPFQLTLTTLGGVVVGRQTVSNGGRYRFLQVSNGDYILTIEVGDRQVARMDLRIDEARKTDIRRNLEFEWSDQAKTGASDQKTVYARSGEQQKVFDEARRAADGGDLASAEKLYVQLTSKDPKDYEAWNELGSVRFSQNDLKGGETAYRKALQLVPNLPVAHQNLGKIFFLQKKYDDSITELEAVVSQADVAEAHMILGEAYLQIKKGSKAVPHLEKAIEMEPIKMADAHLRLATLYRNAGYTDLAVQHYRQYLEKRPDSPGRQQIEKYIKDNTPGH